MPKLGLLYDFRPYREFNAVDHRPKWKAETKKLLEETLKIIRATWVKIFC